MVPICAGRPCRKRCFVGAAISAESVEGVHHRLGPGDHDNYPRLLVRKATFPCCAASFRRTRHAWHKIFRRPCPLHDGRTGSRLPRHGDAAWEKHCGDKPSRGLQDVVSMYCDQMRWLAPGFARITDVAPDPLNLGRRDPGDRRPVARDATARARPVAFLGYTVNREDFWSPSAGFSGNPNMNDHASAAFSNDPWPA